MISFIQKILSLKLLGAAPTPIKLGDQLILKDGKKVSEVYNTPGMIVNLVVSNLFVLAGIVIFFLIIMAGLSYIKDTEKGKEEAKNLATGAVIGFIVMFAAFWIVQIIQYVTKAHIPIGNPFSDPLLGPTIPVPTIPIK